MAARSASMTAPAAGRSDRENARIEITGVTKRFLTPSGEAFTALRDVSFTVEPGQFCAVVGPTGCGKSTTLGLVAGLDQPSDGLDQGRRQARSTASPTGTSFMFQADALLPWKTVLGNVAMGPRLPAACPRRRRQARARDWLRRVGLAGFEDHHPHQLSGGMRKRVAHGRRADQRAVDPADGRAVRRAGRADQAIMQTELLDCGSSSRPRCCSSPTTWRRRSRWPTGSWCMPAGPGTVKAIFDVDLPRPRGAVQEIRFDPRFLELHHQIWESLREEVQRSYARTTARTAMSADTLAATPAKAAVKKAGLSLRRRHKLKIHAAQAVFAVVMLGGWQLFATNKWLGVDPFTYGKPTLIWDSLYANFTKGDQATEFGSYWLQIETTLREAGLGFLLGTAVGVVLGVLLGMNRFLAEVMDPYIKIFNSIPRIVLGEIFLVALGLGQFPQAVARRGSGVLRGLLQRLPGRPRGRPQHPGQRQGARRQADRDRPARRPALGADLDHRQPAQRLRLRADRRDRRRGARRAAGPGPGHRHAPGQVRLQRRVRPMLVIAVAGAGRRVGHQQASSTGSCPGARRRRRRPRRSDPARRLHRLPSPSVRERNPPCSDG